MLNSQRPAADSRHVAYDVDTKPGRWVREQTARRERRILVAVCLGFLITGVFLWFAVGHRVSVGSSLAFLFAALLAREHGNRYVDVHLRLRRGAEAEEAVGETLDGLVREGWRVMHDIDLWGPPNLDHLVSGPKGVFAIETKLRRYEDSDLGRVKNQARLLYRELGVWVTPVICLHTRGREPFHSKGVWIVPHQHLVGWLRRQGNRPVDFERLARFADTV